jgi:hypothetical protein
MISETNIPEKNNYVTFINLDRHWTRFDNDGIRRVRDVEEMADRWNGPGRQYQASSILLCVPCEGAPCLNTPTNPLCVQIYRGVVSFVAAVLV